jgi:methyl-accepting chemotaxis protein
MGAVADPIAEDADVAFAIVPAERIGTAIVALVWLHVPAALGGALAAGIRPWVPVVATASCGLLAIYARYGLDNERGARIALAVAFAAAGGATLMVANGIPWAREAAAVYPFAILAILTILVDWVAISAAAATTLVVCAAAPFAFGVEQAGIGTRLLQALLFIFVAGVLCYIAIRAAAMVERAQMMRRVAIKGIAAARTASDVSKAAIEEKARFLDEREGLERDVASEREVVLGELRVAFAKLGAGKLTARLTTPLPEPFDNLRQEFNQAVEGLASVVESLSERAESIAAGAGEARTAGERLAAQAEQRAHLLKDLGEQAKLAADAAASTVVKAKGSADIAAAAKTTAERGTSAVQSATVSMNGLSDLAGRIGKIIGVIDGIAFQTNLLALNAGVEAARAGDHGRGFAVVASEVRALAQHTADAAKEVKGLIAQSSKQVGEGVGLVEGIGAEVQQLAGAIGEISAAIDAGMATGRELAARLQQLEGAAAAAVKATREAASLTDQSSNAVRVLSGTAAALSNTAYGLLGEAAVARAVEQPQPAQRVVHRNAQVRPTAGRNQPSESKHEGMAPFRPGHIRRNRGVAIVDGATARSLIDFQDEED